MPDLLAGTIVKALDTPPTVFDDQSASFDFTSTTYTTASTAGSYVDCAVVFTAPTTGRVKISTSARLINTTATGGALVAPETRTGGTVGSGTVVDAAADDASTAHYGTTFSRGGASHILSGLTPGSVYNTRLLHRASAGTGSAALRGLIVEAVS